MSSLLEYVTRRQKEFIRYLSTIKTNQLYEEVQSFVSDKISETSTLINTYQEQIALITRQGFPELVEVNSILAGRETRFGLDSSNYYPNGVFDAWTMGQMAPTATDRRFWNNVKGRYVDTATLHTWRYSDRPTGNSNPAIYFDTIEHNLNTAVYYGARALGNILDNSGFTGCSCVEQMPGGPGGPGQSQGVMDKTAVKLKTDQFTALMAFSMAGLFATGIALVILNQVDLLEKLLLS